VHYGGACLAKGASRLGPVTSLHKITAAALFERHRADATAPTAICGTSRESTSRLESSGSAWDPPTGCRFGRTAPLPVGEGSVSIDFSARQPGEPTTGPRVEHQAAAKRLRSTRRSRNQRGVPGASDPGPRASGQALVRSARVRPLRALAVRAASWATGACRLSARKPRRSASESWYSSSQAEASAMSRKCK
jgi:hypothetical protein